MLKKNLILQNKTKRVVLILLRVLEKRFYLLKLLNIIILL